MQVSCRNGIIPCQSFGQRRIQRDLFSGSEIFTKREPASRAISSDGPRWTARQILWIEGLGQHFSIFPKDAQHRFHCGAFPVPRCSPIQNEHAFHPGIPRQRVSQRLLEIPAPGGISLHDFIHKREPSGTDGIRIVHHWRNLRKELFRTMFPELHRAKVQRPVLAVER